MQNAIDLAHALKIDNPHVAILSAMELVNPKLQSTVEAAALCKMADRGQITGGILDGPLALDNAITSRPEDQENHWPGRRPRRHPGGAGPGGRQRAGQEPVFPRRCGFGGPRAWRTRADRPHQPRDAELVRERAIDTDTFDPAELAHGHHSERDPPFVLAAAPILVVLAVNLLMTWVVLPRLDTSFLAEPRWGGISLAAVSGIWSVLTALVVASVFLVLTNLRRLPELRKTLDAGATGATLPVFNVASMAGFGAVVAVLPAFAAVRDGLLAIPGGPLVSMAVATSVMGIITASASAALSITLDALGETYAQLAAGAGIEPSLMHRVASLACGPLSMLPHSGAIVTLLTICGATQRQSFRHIAMVTLVGPLLALVVVIVLGQVFGSF